MGHDAGRKAAASRGMESVTEQASETAIDRWGALGVAAFALVLFLNILPNTFIWDDWQQIFEQVIAFLFRPKFSRRRLVAHLEGRPFFIFLTTLDITIS